MPVPHRRSRSSNSPRWPKTINRRWSGLALASALQRMPVADRWPIAVPLAEHAEDAEDHNLPLMLWYGIEPAVAADKAQALQLVTSCKIPSVRRNITRRVASP